MAATAKQQEQQQQQAAAEEAPPVYTANPALGEHSSDSKGASGSSSALEVKEVVVRSRRSSMVAEIRPVGYDNSSSLPSKEVDAFAYQPAAKQKQKGQKKDDRMLLWFWLPILLLSAIWALHNGWRLVYKTVEFVAPANAAAVTA